jgi:hypothetical protein
MNDTYIFHAGLNRHPPTYANRYNIIVVHDWAFATQQDIDYFNQSLRCRLAPDGIIVFPGWTQ